jgi:hypothetical protein
MERIGNQKKGDRTGKSMDEQKGDSEKSRKLFTAPIPDP